MICDICGDTDYSPYQMVEILESYRTDKIKWICPDCEKEVNSVLEKMKLAAHHWYSRMIKIFMRKRRMNCRKLATNPASMPTFIRSVSDE